MAERSKAHAWKACVGYAHRGFESPSLRQKICFREEELLAAPSGRKEEERKVPRGSCAVKKATARQSLSIRKKKVAARHGRGGIPCHVKICVTANVKFLLLSTPIP